MLNTNKNIYEEVLQFIDSEELTCFTFAELEKKLQGKLPYLRNAVETLVKKGFLDRIEKGKYCRQTFRNEYVIANMLAPNGAIAYWSALNLHGLSNQFPNAVFVQTPISKKNKTIFGVRYNFIKVKQNKATAYEKTGFGNNAFLITTLEKTIVDCFDLPEYSGGMIELFYALKKVELSSIKLIEAAKAVNNLSATKRIGYLIELYKKPNLKQFLSYAQAEIKQNKYALFDPSGIDMGPYNSRWKLRMNISDLDLIAMGNQIY
jgi:predicted transcriptional regulator of viral defense system